MRSGRASSRLAAPRTASTSAAGSRAEASTSSSRAGPGGSSAGAAVSAASRTGSASTSRRSIAPGLTGERRAVLVGVVLGEDEGLSNELQSSFKAAGLYHLLAVSGQNVVILVGTVLVLAWIVGIPRLSRRGDRARGDRRLRPRRRLAAVRRARRDRRGLASLAWLLSRPRDRWHFLALGAVVLLAWAPGTIYEPGFQLSFVAVGRDLRARAAARPRARGVPAADWLREVLALSIACGAATAPILWLQFGTVPGLLAARERTRHPRDRARCSISRSSAPRSSRWLPSAALALAWLNGWLAAYVAVCARLVAGLPHAQLTSGTAVFLLLATPVAVLLLRRLPRWRRPLALCTAAALVPALLVWWLWPASAPAPPTGLRLTVLDVGQGDSILLQVPEGAVLVDQGPPEARVDRQLRELGVSRLAALVVTDGQRDHTGGAEAVIRRSASTKSSIPTDGSDSPYRRGALRAAAARGSPVGLVRAGTSWRLGRLPAAGRSGRTGRGAGDDPERPHRRPARDLRHIDVLLSADAETNVTARLLDRRSRSSRWRTTAPRIPGSRPSSSSCVRRSRSSRPGEPTTTAIRGPRR